MQNHVKFTDPRVKQRYSQSAIPQAKMFDSTSLYSAHRFITKLGSLGPQHKEREVSLN